MENWRPSSVNDFCRHLGNSLFLWGNVEKHAVWPDQLSIYFKPWSVLVNCWNQLTMLYWCSASFSVSGNAKSYYSDKATWGYHTRRKRGVQSYPVKYTNKRYFSETHRKEFLESLMHVQVQSHVTMFSKAAITFTVVYTCQFFSKCFTTFSLSGKLTCFKEKQV